MKQPSLRHHQHTENIYFQLHILFLHIGWQKTSNIITEAKSQLSFVVIRPTLFIKESIVTGDKSNILQGPDASIIHEENVEKLASMTSSEIEEERTKLLANIDPGIVNYLKSRKSQPHRTSDPNKSCCSKKDSSSMEYW